MRNFIILDSKITADCDCCQEIKRRLLLGRKVMTNLDSILKSRDITLPTKVHLWSQSYGFYSSHVWMWELDYKESWVLKNWWFWTVVLKKTLESPCDSKGIQPVYPKGNHSWIFTGRTDAEPETPIIWPPDEKNWLIWCFLMLRKTDGRRRRAWQRIRGWIASPTQWIWVWVISWSWWRTGRSGALQPMGSQKARHNWVN